MRRKYWRRNTILARCACLLMARSWAHPQTHALTGLAMLLLDVNDGLLDCAPAPVRVMQISYANDSYALEGGQRA